MDIKAKCYRTLLVIKDQAHHNISTKAKSWSFRYLIQ